MKIVLPGGTGQIGTLLARTFQQQGHDVVVLSRNVRAAPWRVVAWDAAALGPWAAELDGADVVINLAGRNVNCRYTRANRRAILQSRVASTKAVGLAIQQASRPPRVWLQASTATIYSHRYDAPNDERNGVIGGNEWEAPESWRFSIDVANAWERTLRQAVVPHTRTVAMRSTVVMSPDRGGAFDVLLGLVRRGLGGQVGDGQQYVSWIHDHDFVRAVQWLIAHDDMAGVVNIAAPHPLPNKQFMRDLRAAWGIRVGLPATRWMAAVGALAMRTETELVLKSRRVVPGRLLESGFVFQFPDWPDAARDLCSRWRGEPRRSGR